MNQILNLNTQYPRDFNGFSLEPLDNTHTKLVYRWLSDERIVKYLHFKSLKNLDEAIDLVSLIVKKQNHRYCAFIASKGDHRIGFIILKRTNNFSLCIQVGLLDKQYWGKRIAYTGLDLLLRYYINVQPIYRIWALCHIANKSSVRAMTSVGMHLEGKLRRRGYFPNISSTPQDTLLFSFTK